MRETLARAAVTPRFLRSHPLAPPTDRLMAHRSPRSLRHEYELYIEREIENYKESVPRNALLTIGDEAVAALGVQSQLALTELLLCEEVDRIIRRRLRLPAYQAWRRRRLRELDEMRRPEHWGLRPEDPLVCAIRPSGEAHILVAGARAERSALYLAAHGCDVTAVDGKLDAIERVLAAAEALGLGERVRGCVADLSSFIGAWPAGAPLSGVICTNDAFAGLSAAQRRRAICTLQGVTSDGGIHLHAALGEPTEVSVEELRRRYRGWDVTIGPALGTDEAFFARKASA